MRLGVLFLLAALAIAAPASATFGTIQPGDQLNGGCTLSFVFDGVGALAGKVYISTVEHCVDEPGASLDTAPYEDFGVVALAGDEANPRTDWAFIEVRPQFHPFVKAAVKGHPSYPTGVATRAETSAGDLLQFSGYGMVFEETTLTQENRFGVLAANDQMGVQFVGMGSSGDSGGPIVHIETGKALSIQSRVTAGPAIEDVLKQAAQRGFTVELRTV